MLMLELIPFAIGFLIIEVIAHHFQIRNLKNRLEELKNQENDQQ